MKLLHYAGAGVRGGLVDHVVTLACGLAARGHDVLVVLSPSADVDEAARVLGAAGARVERLTVAGKSDLDGMLCFRKRVAAFDPDVVHVHLSSPIEAIPALASARLAGARRMMTTEHAPTHFPMARAWSHLSKRVASRWLDAVIALSQADAAFLREEFDVPADRIHVIPNGVRVDRALPDRASARARLAAGDPGALWIGFAGGLEAKKGALDLLEAARIANLERAVLVMAGRGSLQATLAERAASLATPVALTGQLPDLGDLLAAIDVFVLPSHQEAMPLSLLEAMAAGLPAIATRVGGIPEMIEDGVSGLLIAPAAPRAIAGALLRLAADPGLRRALGERARERVRERFAAERMIDDVASLYAGSRAARREAVR